MAELITCPTIVLSRIENLEQLSGYWLSECSNSVLSVEVKESRNINLRNIITGFIRCSVSPTTLDVNT